MDRKKKRLLSPLLERTLDALKGQRSMQTLENYHSSINKVKEFVGDGWEHLTVEDITRGWTDRFTTWLESHHGDKPQTVDFYLRTFRAVYGHALALSSEGTDGKPFSDITPAAAFLPNVRSGKKKYSVCSRPACGRHCRRTSVRRWMCYCSSSTPVEWYSRMCTG